MRRLRRIPETEQSLLIALTGYGQKGDRQQAHDAGFAAHLVKPTDPAALAQMIADWRAARDASSGALGAAKARPAAG
jgi:CheY-like chemotaxis protein